ncbi:MAG TPA: twin-arginine translocation signal domain-containing protein [Bryobacteraceae bacterium]|nr:twin-arginine translocation signal domain-containing protein [Bryobacteraceae bacterium]
MDTQGTPGSTPRRTFLKGAAAAAVAAGAAKLSPQASAADPPKSQKIIGIQVGSISFLDEGVDQVLDNLQKLGNVNTIFLATFTYGRGIAGRQIPGQPLPDHGKQSYDQDTFHGGNYATPHPTYYKDTVLKPQDTKAPDHGNVDILELVLPKAKQRSLKVFCWYEDVFRSDIPNIQQLQEIDLQGRRRGSLCPYNPDYRNFLIGLTTDYCASYDVDGVMWGSERQGPLNNAIGYYHGGRPNPLAVACFCEHHQKAARERGINIDRAKAGYQKLAQYVQAALSNSRPSDGYFVAFWRLLLEYPEILAWEKLWSDGQYAVYEDVHRAAKSTKASAQVGLHIWHTNSFSAFFRAEQDYAALAKVADCLKVVAYNNCGGPRYVETLNNVGTTIFRDIPKEELLSLHNHILGYSNEKDFSQLPQSGLSAEYVAAETRRALAGVNGNCAILPGIDIDIPTGRNQKKTKPEDVYQSTSAALKAGAQGVIFSRKYSEMRLDNLAGGGRAVKEFNL